MSVVRSTGLALVGLLVSAATVTAEAPAVTRRVLANGMTVLVQENHAARVVAVSLQANAGARPETETTAGITNFLHKVMVRGTSKRSAVQLAEAAEEIGGTLDASGDGDHGEIRGQALARHWEVLLELVAEVALDPALRPSEVDRERRLILGQIQTRADNPFPLAVDALLSDLYGPHPYALPAAGRRPSVEGLTRETLRGHYEALYRADRLVLAVSGGVPRDQVVRSVEKLFGRLPPPTEKLREVTPAPKPTRERRVIEKAAQQAQILVGYLGPSVTDADYPAVKVLTTLLGGGMSGRLFVELREKRGLAYSLGVVSPPRKGPAYVISYLGTAPQNVEAAEAGVLRELERVQKEPPTAEELARAKAYLLGTQAMDRRTNARQAWYLAFFEIVGAGWDFPDRYARAVEEVTVADVTAAAQRYLTRPTTIVLTPTR